MNHRREEAQMITVKTYRGHIRNWKELCAELEVDPALPRAEKEQEILTKAYQKWGGEMADHIYGMFAFALWDEEEKKTVLLNRSVRNQAVLLLSDRRRRTFVRHDDP